MPFLPEHLVIPYQSLLYEEDWHLFEVGFPPDVFIIDVVLLCLPSSPYQRSHLIGVGFVFACFLNGKANVIAGVTMFL